MRRRLLLLCLLMGLVAANAGEAVKLRSVTLNQWQQQLQQYRPDIVVVDMWATWCDSCLKRFPHMVDMQRRFASKGVQFVSLLLEDPEETDAIERARGFLQRQQAEPAFHHYLMNENLMVSFEQLDLLGIPAVFIYARDGALTQRLTGDDPNNQFTEVDIEQALEALTAK